MGISENFGMQKFPCEAGEFWRTFRGGESREKQKRRLMSQMENGKAIVSDAKDTIRSNFAKMASALSGCEGSKNEVGNWKKSKAWFN